MMWPTSADFVPPAAPPSPPPPAPAPPPTCPPPVVTFIGVIPNETQATFNATEQNQYTQLVFDQAVANGAVNPVVVITLIEDRPAAALVQGINVHTQVTYPGPACQEQAAAAFVVYLNTNTTWIQTAYGPTATVLAVNFGCAGVQPFGAVRVLLMGARSN